MMIEDTHSTTGILKHRSPLWWWIRGHWQVLASVLCTSVVWLVVQSVGVGHYQSEFKKMGENVEGLKASVGELKTKVDNLAENGPTVTNRELASLRGEVNGFKEWKERITGVAETVTVPKARHAKHPP